jgi:hypothetical protein
MKTWTITTPYRIEISIQNETFIEVDEDQVREHFEVESTDDIDPAELEEYLKECGEENARWTPDEIVLGLVKDEIQNSPNWEFITDEDEFEIEVEDDEELEAAE